MTCSRSVFLNDINSYIIDTKSYLSDVLSKLGWSDECYTYEKNKSDDRGNSSNDSKSDVCRKSDSVEPCYNFNLSENASDINEVLTLPQSVKKCKEQSLLDLLAKERDMKRRRISYKGRIHTKHKSHNEILREVIAQQMDLIGDSSSFAVEIAETPIAVEAEAIDLSRMYIDNPHLAWKYVSKEYKLIMRERESDRDKRHTSKSDRCKETSRAKHRNDHKSDGKSRDIRNRDPLDDYRKEVKKVRRDRHSDSEDEICDSKRNYNGYKKADRYNLNGDNEWKHDSLNYLSDSDRGRAKVNLNQEKYKHHHKIKEKNKTSYNNDKHKGSDDDDTHRKRHKRKEDSKKKSKESKDIHLKKHKKRSRSRSKKRRRRSKSS